MCPNMECDIGDGDNDIPAITVRFRKDGIVVIPGIVIVDGDERDGAKIAAVFCVARSSRGPGFDEDIVRKLERYVVGCNGGKTDSAGILPAAECPGDTDTGRARPAFVDGFRQDQVVMAYGVDIACSNRRGAVPATTGAGDESIAPDVLVDAGHFGRRRGKDAAYPAMTTAIGRAVADGDQDHVSNPCRRGPTAAGGVENDEWRLTATGPRHGTCQRMPLFVEVYDLDNDVAPIMIPAPAARSQAARPDFLAFRGGFRRFLVEAFLRARRSSAISSVTSAGSVPAGSDALVRLCLT